jgi:alcohol dehydrogenase class IV
MTTTDPLLELTDRDWPQLDRFVAVTDPQTAALPAAAAFLATAAATHVVPDRPTLAEAEQIVALLRSEGAEDLVGIGSGVALDTAKLALYAAGEATHPRFVAVPAGPEPYRAITGFSMYDSGPGARTGVYEPWFRAASIHVVDELLEQVDATAFGLFGGDSLVHAVESLLSRLSGPESESHAKRAANIFVEQGFAADPDRSLLVEASLRAAVAFELTKLGLAHALSRPMGIATGLSHDLFNLMLGAPVVRFWGDEVLRSSPLATGLGLEPLADRWIELLERYRIMAGLPASLSETSLDRAGLEQAVAWAPNSSGIPNLPRPLEEGDLARIAEDAWSA